VAAKNRIATTTINLFMGGPPGKCLSARIYFSSYLAFIFPQVYKPI
jgi:hypothetical protein